jgi:L-fuconolactonase
MTLLDTHVHVWDPARLDYPWLAGLPHLRTGFLPDRIAALEDARMVFVEADCAPGQAIDEARWVDRLEWPELAGIVAAADLRADELDRHLDDLSGIGRFVGVRHLLQGEDVVRFADPALRRGLELVAARGLTFDGCVRHEQLPALAGLLESVPDARVVLDHLGKPPVDAGLDSATGEAWAASIERLARLPHLHVKLSGLAAEAGSRAAFDAHADAFVAHAVAVFGPERAMLGSDWPVSAELGAAEQPRDWTGRVRDAAGVDDAGWAQIASETGSRFYGLQPA